MSKKTERVKFLGAWLIAVCFGALVTFGGTQVNNNNTESAVAAKAGLEAKAAAPHSTHVQDHQHWIDRRCSDGKYEFGTVMGAGQKLTGPTAIERGAHCWNQWEEDVVNTNAIGGLAVLLNCNFVGTTYCFNTAWYVGLVGTSATFASTDTMVNHSPTGSWLECTACFTGNRPLMSLTSAASTTNSVSNAASVASFAISATTSINGAFLVGGTIGTSINGTGGTLWGGATFTSRAVLNGDTLNVTITITAT